MNRSSLFHGADQRLKQKGLLHRRDSIKKQTYGKEGKSGKRSLAKEKKLNISLAINEALNDLKNIHEFEDLETEMVPPSPIKKTSVVELDAVSPIKEKQRRSSFDITHSKSPIILPIVPEVVIEPMSLFSPEPMESEHPTEEELLDETDTVIYLLTSRNGSCKIPTKSTLSPKQEIEFQSIIHSIISARHSLYKQNDDQDIVHYYFGSSEVSHLVNILRTESPYGTSCNGFLLELLCKFDIDYTNQITKYIAEFVWQFVLDERALPLQTDDDYKTIQQQIGSIHRYVNFFQFLVESLRLNVAMSPPTCPEQMQAYLDQSAALLHIVKCLLCTRSTVEKYTELLSSLTICLFSISPQEIESFYQFLLRHWPRGYSEKTIGLIQFLENLLSSSPPLYLTPFLKDVVHKLFKKICQELLGSQVEISKRCAYFLQNYYLRSNYIAVDQRIIVTVKNALEKGMEHWNEIIAMICEKAVDLILDDI